MVTLIYKTDSVFQGVLIQELQIHLTVKLTELICYKNTRLGIKKDYSDLIINSSENYITGKLIDVELSNINFDPIVSLPISNNKNNKILEFQTDPFNSDIALGLSENSNFKISGVSVYKLFGFSELDPSTNLPVSKLKSGVLNYRDTSLTLKENQIIEVRDLKNCKLAIENNKDDLKIILEGEALDLQVGYLGETQPVLQASRIENNFFDNPRANLIWKLITGGLSIRQYPKKCVNKKQRA